MHSATSALHSPSPTLPLCLFTPPAPPSLTVPILTSLKTSLGVPHQGWGVQTLFAVPPSTTLPLCLFTHLLAPLHPHPRSANSDKLEDIAGSAAPGVGCADAVRSAPLNHFPSLPLNPPTCPLHPPPRSANSDKLEDIAGSATPGVGRADAVHSHVPILTNLKTSLGVPHQGWGVQTLCTVTGIYRGPQDMSAVNCNIQGAVVDIFLKQRFMRGIMHPDISKFTALSALDVSSNFLSGPLDPFISPLNGLTALKYLVMSYNFFSGSLPSTIASIKSLYMLKYPVASWLFCAPLPPRPPMPHAHVCVCDLCVRDVVSARGVNRSVGWNYLTGSVPVLGTSTLQVLDLKNNYFIGKFPITAN
ncbi:unnamed protein product [Closterium sp. Yama58-4]|nr:unnamed protein product [Closterium sp. Yama58-4]